MQPMSKWFAGVVFAVTALAQPPVSETVTEQKPDAAATDLQDDRILGVVPNYNTVETPVPHYEPLGLRQKYRLAAVDSFDPYSWVITGVYAGVEQKLREDVEYGFGAQGYGKRYGALFADQAFSNYLTEAVLPSGMSSSVSAW